jgi:hypothetical protein
MAGAAPGKSGWLRVYKYKELLASAFFGATGSSDAEPQKIAWSRGTAAFRLVRTGRGSVYGGGSTATLFLATLGARLVLSRFDPDTREFLRLCVRHPTRAMMSAPWVPLCVCECACQSVEAHEVGGGWGQDLPAPGTVSTALDVGPGLLWIASATGFFSLPMDVGITATYNPSRTSDPPPPPPHNAPLSTHSRLWLVSS